MLFGGNGLSWLAALIALGWAYPWVRLTTRERVLGVVLTVGLSLGGTAWAVLLAGVIGGVPHFWPVTGVLLLAHFGGWAVIGRRRLRMQAGQGRGASLPGRSDASAAALPAPDSAPRWLPRLIAALVIFLVALTLFNAAYWPFVEDDTMTLYGPMAFRFVQAGQFDGAGLYDAYPMLDPLVMAYVGLANGAPQEYASRLLIAALALGAIGAAYTLGRDLYRPPVGLIAAYLLAATPILHHWAASGYTDLPAGTYALLAAVFAWRLFTHPQPVNALLAGLLAGLAAFTKNGALLMAGSLLGWVIYTHWHARFATEPAGQPIKPRHAALIALGWLLAAGPWYAHTLHAYGLLVPPTGWTDQAQRTLPVLVGPALMFGHFMLAGPLSIAGAGQQIVLLWRARPAFNPRAALLLGFGVPFWLVWWLMFSYDTRFLLLVWGFFAVMGARLLADALARLPGRESRWMGIGAALLLIGLALPAMRIAVDHKPELLRDPFMDDSARHAVQLGPRWDVITWLQTQGVPAESRILTADYRFVFPLLGDVETAFWDTVDPAVVAGYDYWITSPGLPLPDWAGDPAAVRPLVSSGGYTLYEVLNPPLPAE